MTDRGTSSMEAVLRSFVPFEGGLHVRAAARIAEICRAARDGAVTVSHRGARADGRSVTALLALGAQRGDEIEVRGVGAGGLAAVDAIHALFRAAAT